MRTSLNESMGIFFYGLHGLDCILMGQKVPYPKLEREPTPAWKRTNTASGLCTRTAMDVVRPTWS